WYKLGDMSTSLGMPTQYRIEKPHKSVYSQYSLWEHFIMSVYNVQKAIEETESNDNLCNSLMAEIKELEQLLEQPIYKLEIPAFESLEDYTKDGGWVTDDKEAEKAKKALITVCKSLISSYLVDKQQFSVSKKKGRKKKIKWVKDGIMKLVGDEEILFREKLGRTAQICEEVFTNCQQVGDSMHPKTLYEEVWNEKHYNQTQNWNTVSEAVSNVNKWARRQKKLNSSKILRCTKTEVIRLV
ncbi:MAG: hypothetical protein O3A80_04540, partial [bacterium]|nr:hypothetical protein [bacterium]